MKKVILSLVVCCLSMTIHSISQDVGKSIDIRGVGARIAIDARNQCELGNWERAKQLYLQLYEYVETNSLYYGPPSVRGRDYYELGQCYVNTGDYENAKQFYFSYIKNEPCAGNAYDALANLLRTHFKNQKAADEIKKIAKPIEDAYKSVKPIQDRLNERSARGEQVSNDEWLSYRIRVAEYLESVGKLGEAATLREEVDWFQKEIERSDNYFRQKREASDKKEAEFKRSREEFEAMMAAEEAKDQEESDKKMAAWRNKMETISAISNVLTNMTTQAIQNKVDSIQEREAKQQAAAAEARKAAALAEIIRESKPTAPAPAPVLTQSQPTQKQGGQQPAAPQKQASILPVEILRFSSDTPQGTQEPCGDYKGSQYWEQRVNYTFVNPNDFVAEVKFFITIDGKSFNYTKTVNAHQTYTSFRDFNIGCNMYNPGIKETEIKIIEFRLLK